MSSPWAAIAKPEPVALHEIMSEQYASHLQSQQDAEFVLDQQLAACQQQQQQQQPPQSQLSATTETDPLPTAVDDANAVALSVATCSITTAHCPLATDRPPTDEAEAAAESDRLIAEILQAQFDREHDAQLQRYEQQRNGASKVTISLANYKRSAAAPCTEGGLLEEADGRQQQQEQQQQQHPLASDSAEHWDRFVPNERSLASMSREGFTYDEDGVKVTKHDARLNGVRNACRVMSFPPEFHTGDAAGFDMQLPNSVFNQLKTYSQRGTAAGKGRSQQGRKSGGGGGRPRGAASPDGLAAAAAPASVEQSVDAGTLDELHKLEAGGYLQRVSGVISSGKEAVVLHAYGNPAYRDEEEEADAEEAATSAPAQQLVSDECAIKVFRHEFRNRAGYIEADYRFADRFNKQNKRAAMQLWAEKEMHNLQRLANAAVRAPRVVLLRKHLLCMEFVGEQSVPAPRLKDARLGGAEAASAYEQVVRMMRRMYRVAQLVHADLSEYNILWWREECWFVDVSMSVVLGHPSALEFLMRDCGNVATYFARRVPNAISREDLFRTITGMDPELHKTAMLERIHDKGPTKKALALGLANDDENEEAGSSSCEQQHQKPAPNTYPFEYAWEMMEQQRQAIAASNKDRDQDDE